MTSPFTDEELRQLAKTRKNTDVPAQWISALARELLEARKDARRWQWLRQQGGWPDSEAAVSGYTPEQFDAMADAALEGK